MKSRFLEIFFVTVLALSLITSGCGKKIETKATPDAGKTQAPTATTPAATAQTKEFVPQQPITLIIPAAAGGSTDMVARAVEKVWKKYCPQPAQIVNKPGAGGLEGSNTVAKSKPDGYTLLFGYGSGPELVAPHVEDNYAYDPFKDMIAINRVFIAPVVLLVKADSPINSIADVVKWAKENKKPVTIATANAASATDIVAKGIGVPSGIEIASVPHAGSSQAMITLLGGNTLLGANHPPESLPHIKAGKLKAIAIATPERDPVLKDVPTLYEQGIKFHTWGSVKGAAVPAKTPVEVVKYYEGVFKKVCEDPEFLKVCTDIGQSIQYQNTTDFQKFIKTAYDEYGVLINQLGLSNKKK